jgi:hypothetical protein
MTPEQAKVLLALMTAQPEALATAIADAGIADADAETFGSDLSDALGMVAAEDVDEDAEEPV